MILTIFLFFVGTLSSWKRLSFLNHSLCIQPRAHWVIKLQLKLCTWRTQHISPAKTSCGSQSPSVNLQLGKTTTKQSLKPLFSQSATLDKFKSVNLSTNWFGTHSILKQPNPLLSHSQKSNKSCPLRFDPILTINRTHVAQLHL